MRNKGTLLGLAALVLAGCSAPTTPTSPVPDSPETAAIPTATSTSAVIEAGPSPTRLTGVGTAFRRAVANVYGAACAGDRSLVTPEIQAWPEIEVCPELGTGREAMVVGTTVAVAQVGDDLLYGFDQGQGFTIVAARVPSLGGAYYGALPKTVALIGSDARPGEDAATARADSIHILGLNGAGQGALVGIPRDSWVDYANGGRGKINGSLSRGGPSLFLQTLANVTGLSYDGYVITGFEGFQEMWGKVLGGANLDLAESMSDRAAGANFSSGHQYFNGPQALAFARARKTLGGGDLERSFNGGVLILEAIEGSSGRGPLYFPDLLAGAWPWMVTDLTAGELLAVAALINDTPREGIVNTVAPGSVGSAGAASVVYLSSSAPAVFSDLADGALGS